MFFSLLNFKFTKSLPIIFRKIPIGVTIKKKIENITIGGINLARTSANFIQITYKGVNSFEFNTPKIKNKNEITIRVIDGFCPF